MSQHLWVRQNGSSLNGEQSVTVRVGRAKGMNSDRVREKRVNKQRESKMGLHLTEWGNHQLVLFDGQIVQTDALYLCGVCVCVRSILSTEWITGRLVCAKCHSSKERLSQKQGSRMRERERDLSLWAAGGWRWELIQRDQVQETGKGSEWAREGGGQKRKSNREKEGDARDSEV